MTRMKVLRRWIEQITSCQTPILKQALDCAIMWSGSLIHTLDLEQKTMLSIYSLYSSGILQSKLALRKSSLLISRELTLYAVI